MATPARLQCSLHPQPRAHPTAAQGRRRLGDLDRRGVGPRPTPRAARRLGRARQGRRDVCFEGAENLPGGRGSKYGTSVTRCSLGACPIHTALDLVGDSSTTSSSHVTISHLPKSLLFLH
ncbi:hypothetical protein PVAP13_3NG056831 [Panicum virgatum]|uniref:Uncharacterized protein n=1 Tax=Panicum virgatum TaxID=38727 RepID=A0A8T0TUT9_PANVG|nr:hypothetical protein PVAP13_3NG056831 [Panicum virgatum]